jgi:hypothetical protein
MDVQHFPGSLWGQAQIGEHDFEPCAQQKTGLPVHNTKVDPSFRANLPP